MTVTCVLQTKFEGTVLNSKEAFLNVLLKQSNKGTTEGQCTYIHTSWEETFTVVSLLFSTALLSHEVCRYVHCSSVVPTNVFDCLSSTFRNASFDFKIVPSLQHAHDGHVTRLGA